MRYKIYFPKETLNRIQEYLSFISEGDLDLIVTKHWTDWLSNQKESINIGADFIEIDTSRKNGFDTDLLSTLKNKKTFSIFGALRNLITSGVAQYLPKNTPLERFKSYLNTQNIKHDVPIPDSFVSRADLLAHYHFSEIVKDGLAADLGDINYLEIGPGSALLCELVINKLKPKRVLLIELSENVLYSFIRLQKNNPGLRIQLPNEIDDSIGYDVRYYLPSQINDIPVDNNLMVNTESFGEMMPETVSDYFSLLRRKSSENNLFYCCNRVEKWMQNGRSLDPIAVRFHSYPWKDDDVTYTFHLALFYRVFTYAPFFIRLLKLSK